MRRNDYLNRDNRWWLVDPDERHQAICAQVTHERTQDATRRADMRFWLDMYGCSELTGANVGLWVTTGMGAPPLSLNVVRVIVDAARAEVCQTKPRPTFLTDGGDYRLQRKAKKRQQFCEGLFYDVGLYDLAPKVFDHTSIFGTGTIHVFEEFDKPKVERVPRWELILPKADSASGNPRQIFRTKPYDRYHLRELAEQWATAESGNVSTKKLSEIRDAIDKADPPGHEDVFGLDAHESDLVMVHEAWRLPSGPKAKGRHSIVISGATLVDDDYEDDWFPFEHMRWEEDPVFFWGTGICELLAGIQYEINRLALDIQEAHHLLGHAYWAVPRGATITEGSFNNITGHTIEFDGPMGPQLVAPVVVSQEVYAHLWQLYQKAFELARISPMSAMGQKPAGLDSGEAQRVYEDIQNKRFGSVHDNWDKLFMGCAKQLMARANDIQKRTGKFAAKHRNGRFLKTISISELAGDEDSFDMQMFPTSVLPSTPAGKTATVEQWIKLGWLSPAEGKRLINFPDLQSFLDAEEANQELVSNNIEQILEHGEPLQWPEPFDDLVVLKLAMTLAYVEAKNGKVEEEKLDIMRQYIQRCVALDAPPGPPPGAGPPGPPGPPMPPGGPMPPPGAGPPPPPAMAPPN